MDYITGILRQENKELIVNRLKKSMLMILSLASAVMLGGCGSAINEKQNAQEAEGQRVVALSVSLVDILAQLDVELVGVPESKYELNEKMQDVTKVGLSMSPDVEAIAQLKPTHVLSLTTIESMIKPKLEQIGIEGTYLNLENIETLKESIRAIGNLFDRNEEAEHLINNFEVQINETLESIKEKEAPKVLILFGFPGNYMAATSSSFVGQMVELLGGINIVKDSSMAYAQVNLEALLVEKPDIILRMTHGVKEDVIEMFDKEFSENPIWSQFEAVQNGAVVDLDDSLFNVSASLETAVALKELAEILYE